MIDEWASITSVFLTIFHLQQTSSYNEWGLFLSSPLTDSPKQITFPGIQ